MNFFKLITAVVWFGTRSLPKERNSLTASNNTKKRTHIYSNTHVHIMKKLRIKNLEAEMWLSKHNIDKIHFSLKISKTEACEAEGLNIIPCLYQK